MRSSGLNSVLGWKGFRATWAIGIDLSAPSSVEARPPAVPRSASSPLPSRLGVFSVATVFSLRASLDQFLGDIHISLRAARGRIVQNDRLSEARCFRESDISGYYAVEYLRS